MHVRLRVPFKIGDDGIAVGEADRSVAAFQVVDLYSIGLEQDGRSEAFREAGRLGRPDIDRRAPGSVPRPQGAERELKGE